MIDDERANKSDLVDVMSKLDPYANGAFLWPTERELPEGTESKTVVAGV
jgi:hypothetical protein